MPIPRSGYDYIPALEVALSRASLLDPDNNSELDQKQQDWLARFKERSDTFPLPLTNSDGNNVVYAKAESDYPGLIKQAHLVIAENQSVDLGKLDELVQREFVHESMHIAAAKRASGLIIINCGVRMQRLKAEGRLVNCTNPFISIKGWLRKVDFAAIASAPRELSPGDLVIINGLGYEDAAEVDERRQHARSKGLALVAALNVTSKCLSWLDEPLWQSGSKDQAVIGLAEES